MRLSLYIYTKISRKISLKVFHSLYFLVIYHYLRKQFEFFISIDFTPPHLKPLILLILLYIYFLIEAQNDLILFSSITEELIFPITNPLIKIYDESCYSYSLVEPYINIQMYHLLAFRDITWHYYNFLKEM